MKKIKEVERKKGMTLNQAKRALRKEQDILCGNKDVYIIWLSLALQMLQSGDTVRATVYSPEGVPTPKKEVAIHNKAVDQVCAALTNKK